MSAQHEEDSGVSLVRPRVRRRWLSAAAQEGIVAGALTYIVTTLPLALGYWLLQALFTEALGLRSRYLEHAGFVEPRSWWVLFVKSLPLAGAVVAAAVFPTILRVRSPVGPAHSAVRTRAIGLTLAIAWLLTLACVILWDFTFLGLHEGKFRQRSITESLGLSAFYIGTYTGLPLTATLIPLPRFATFVSALDCATEHGIDIHILLGHVLTFISALHGFLYMGVYAALNESWKIVKFNKEWVNNAAGTTALGFLLILWVMALEPARRKAFAAFRIMHIVLAACFVIAAAMHWKFMWIYVLPGGVLLAADFAIRTAAALSQPLPVSALSQGGGNLLTLAIPSSPSSSSGHCSAGATVRISLAPKYASAPTGWHPFTAIPSEDGAGWIMHARVTTSSRWTGRAAQQAAEGNITGAFVHGPYGGIDASWLLYESNEGVLMLGAGTGITPILSLLSKALQRASADRENGLPYPPRLVWSVQDPRDAVAILRCHPSTFEWLYRYNRLQIFCTAKNTAGAHDRTAPDTEIEPVTVPAASGCTQQSPPRALAVAVSWLAATISVVLYEGIYNDWKRHSYEREGPIPLSQQGWFVGLVLMIVPHVIAYSAALVAIIFWRSHFVSRKGTAALNVSQKYAPTTAAGHKSSVINLLNTVSAKGERPVLETEVLETAKEAFNVHRDRAAVIVSGPRHFRRAAKVACRSQPEHLPPVHYLSFSFEL